MRRYRLDPRWITLRYPATCLRCAAPLRRGSRVLFFPSTRDIFCDAPRCGVMEWIDFRSAVGDEEGVPFAS